MSDLLKERNELLEAVKAPERRKKQPGNGALLAAIIFSNLVFCLLDVISGVTVYWMTNFILYGILTFLAGFVPLLLHELMFVRAFASEDQKRIAISGAITALCSIILIGVMAGYVNVMGINVDARGTEVATVIILVLIAAFHAVLTAVYFYVDPGIKANQATAQAVARAILQGEQIKAGDFVMELTQRSVNNRKAIGSKFNNPDALYEILRQMGFPDENHDGIPDVLQRKPQMQSYNSEARLQVSERGNGHRGDSSDPNA